MTIKTNGNDNFIFLRKEFLAYFNLARRVHLIFSLTQLVKHTHKADSNRLNA